MKTIHPNWWDREPHPHPDAERWARPLSDECRLGYPSACTGVANPHQAPRDRVACHGNAHVATF